MFLDGEMRDGYMKSKDYKKVSDYVTRNADRFQANWDEFQNSEY